MLHTEHDMELGKTTGIGKMHVLQRYGGDGVRITFDPVWTWLIEDRRILAIFSG